MAPFDQDRNIYSLRNVTAAVAGFDHDRFRCRNHAIVDRYPVSTLRHLFWFVLVVWWTTLRHEVSHALAAVLEGAEILQLRLLPGIHDELGFYFGYVEHDGDVTWLTDAAPFITDSVLLLLAAIVGAVVLAKRRL